MQTPEFRKLEFEMTEDGICILTFNIPEKLNALNADCHEDLHTFVDFLESEPAARVGIVPCDVFLLCGSRCDVLSRERVH